MSAAVIAGAAASMPIIHSSPLPVASAVAGIRRAEGRDRTEDAVQAAQAYPVARRRTEKHAAASASWLKLELGASS